MLGTSTYHDEDYVIVDQLKAQAIAAVTNPSLGIANAQVRPLRANDLNTAFGDVFYNFTMNATPGSPSPLTSSGFTTATGKAYAFYGLRDLTPGTKTVTGLKFTVNGKDIPLQPIPLTANWTNLTNTTYFNVVKALQPNQSLVVNLYGVVASSTVSVQLIGYIAESGGNE